MRVIGTAGHVDHGKSTLVQALSGIDPDRLQEEKQRGMTIDLGFAWIELPIPQGQLDSASHPTHTDNPSATESKPQSGKSKSKAKPKSAAKPGAGTQTTLTSSPATESVGIVDVPGHIDFIKNMLAGVGGIDAAVLVIAADEGVMPQTREHLAILDLLGVPSGVVALTKVDLIDEPDWLDLIELDVAELLQDTRLMDAPILRVSATTGEGLPELRDALGRTLAKLEPRRNRARPRLPIDRIFTLPGFGTVVTGTLSDGDLTVGDSVEVLPQKIPARIRGLQTHKKQIWQGEPGSRVAVNLSNISANEIRRGNVLAKPDTLRSTLLVDVSIRLLSDTSKPIVHNQAVDFFSGASDSPARVRLMGTEQLEPGQEGWLQLRLERPIVLTSGDRYILRQPSPSVTIGGGVVLAPHPQRRWRRFDETAIQRMRTLAKGAPDEIVLQTISRNPLALPDHILGQSGLDLTIASEALQELYAVDAIVALSASAKPPRPLAVQSPADAQTELAEEPPETQPAEQPKDIPSDAAILSLEAWQLLQNQMQEILQAFHVQNPLRKGMQRGELRSRLQAAINAHFREQPQFPVRLFNLFVDRLKAEGSVNADDGAVWEKDFSVSLTIHQQAMIDDLLSQFSQNRFSPPNAADSLRVLDNSEELLEHLVERGTLVRHHGNILFRTEDAEEMQQQIRSFIQENGSITLGQTRDLFQTSRKYVQAILEDMDTRRITRREDDVRVLR